jgi:hypothetical protein
MVRSRPPKGKKYFTVAEANATLPYVRSIVRDITGLANQLRERQEQLTRLQSGGSLSAAHREELEQIVAELERGQQRMGEYRDELVRLGVELKDYFLGLIDFPSQYDGRVVYLCWRLDEPEVAFWHELDAGFGGRQKLEPSQLHPAGAHK